VSDEAKPATPRRNQPLEDFVQRVGKRRRPFTDLYAFLLLARWSTVVALAALFYLGANAIFAGLYYSMPGSVANANGYLDHFFFSVQTFASIGYGFMYSQTRWGNALVVCEAFVSLLSIALLTGIVFAKFARPHARILFSTPVCIERRNGIPTLTFRVANERGNDVVEASIRVSALITTFTKEGRRMRRFYDLDLERGSTPVFILSWQIFHPIDESSPLYGITCEQMIADDVRLLVSVTGLDGTFAQTIHARHNYWAEDILEGHRFVDVIENLDGGVVRMDFRKFHLTVPEDTSEESVGPGAGRGSA
jgi:inward rectifier potassium channel